MQAGEMAIAGSARTLSGSRVLFRLDGANRLIVQFEGWAGTQAVVEPIPITLPTSKGHEVGSQLHAGEGRAHRLAAVEGPIPRRRRVTLHGTAACMQRVCSVPLLCGPRPPNGRRQRSWSPTHPPTHPFARPAGRHHVRSQASGPPHSSGCGHPAQRAAAADQGDQQLFGRPLPRLLHCPLLLRRQVHEHGRGRVRGHGDLLGLRLNLNRLLVLLVDSPRQPPAWATSHPPAAAAVITTVNLSNSNFQCTRLSPATWHVSGPSPFLHTTFCFFVQPAGLALDGCSWQSARPSAPPS